MTMPATEEKLAQASAEEVVSPEQSDTSLETETKESTGEIEVEGEAKDKKGKADDTFESRIQSEVDKRVNQYRETREGDTALIRSQAAKIKELSLKQSETKLTKAMQAVLAGDEENGIEPDKQEARSKAFEEIKATIQDYNEKATEVLEVAELSATLTKRLDKGVVDHFNLNDANPTVRARGITELVIEASHFISREEAFNTILEEIPLLQKGSEVRKQIDSFIEEYMELSPGKARDLLISKLKREMSISPKQKPPTPSGDSGGIDLSKLSGEELLRQAVAEDRRKGK